MRYSFEILEYQTFPGNKIYSDQLKQILNDSLYLNDELRLSVSGKEISLRDSYNNNLWSKPIQCPGIPKNAWQSANRILLTTNTEEYHAWGHLGPSLIIDVDSGKIIKEVKGSHGKPVGNGSFIVGLEGYGVFNSWLYDSNGELIQTWRSCGHYVIDKNENIVVIEQDRVDPTNAHVVRLQLNGSIEKGEKLTSSRASKPVLLPNGNIVFENSGIIKILDSNLKAIAQKELLEINTQNAWMYLGKLELIGKAHLFITILERTDGKEAPIAYKTHQWLVHLKRV